MIDIAQVVLSVRQEFRSEYADSLNSSSISSTFSHIAFLTRFLNQLIPLRMTTRRPRPSDPWCDAECRTAKRQTRQHECAYTSACRRLNRTLLRNLTSSESTDAATARVAAAKSAWYEQRRAYRQLSQRKCTAFWVDKVESERSHPSKLWESVDKLPLYFHPVDAPQFANL